MGDQGHMETHKTFSYIWMALYAVHQRSFAQMAPTAFGECEFNIILTDAILLDDFLPESFDLIGDIHAFKGGIVAYALEKGDAESRSCSPGWTQHSMSCA